MTRFLLILSACIVCILSGCDGISANQDQFVLAGGITASDGKVTLDDTWFQETDAGKSNAENGKEIQVSISNCAGYIASAKMKYIGHIKWEASIIPDSVAADATEKIKACKVSPTLTYDTGTAFAVISSGNNYKNYKLENPDLRRVFASLPRDIKAWANCEESEVDHCVREEKDTLSKSGDDWADTDGDGEIDLVIVKGNCSKSGDYTCGKTLKWIGWRWVQIASSRPA